MQLFFMYYNYYAIILLKNDVINKCHVKKSVNCIIITSELKIGFII